MRSMRYNAFSLFNFGFGLQVVDFDSRIKFEMTKRKRKKNDQMDFRQRPDQVGREKAIQGFFRVHLTK